MNRVPSKHRRNNAVEALYCCAHSFCVTQHAALDKLTRDYVQKPLTVSQKLTTTVSIVRPTAAIKSTLNDVELLGATVGLVWILEAFGVFQKAKQRLHAAYATQGACQIFNGLIFGKLSNRLGNDTEKITSLPLCLFPLLKILANGACSSLYCLLFLTDRHISSPSARVTKMNRAVFS